MIKRFWWVFVLSSSALVFSYQSLKTKKAMIQELSFRIQEAEKEKLLCTHEKEDSLLRIASQSDPAWIEMVLMRELGVVPEGWLKVHFKK